MKHLLYIFILFFVTIVGCQPTAKSPQGFSLPEGDSVKGEWVFTKYQCISCHTIGGMQQPEFSEMNIVLGGDTPLVKTYADLVTSIINPSHKVAKGFSDANVSENGTSKMIVFNDIMTVKELVDVVTFLQPKYKLVPYNKSNYPVYPYYNR